ncbi:uncharacterized protein LOC122857262 isoform X2 [Aphidius gifuensis]|uniref:uncharacterized protein LOC122857262 isoform X2 n=1 Tax=Aphidius gifuensis TaxID=684658 RepID=UPI001CDC6674|nr:uncharacterized protein LOC122857262 isoform X2 [Aphidius gifuensis]
MADHDKGRRKWGRNSHGSRVDRDQSMNNRGGGHRIPQPLYTPGSGPLKKTGRQCDDYESTMEVNQQQERQKQSSIQDRLSLPQQNNRNPMTKSHPGSQQTPEVLVEKLRLANLNQNNEPIMTNTFGRKNKKPEQPLYIAKKLQEQPAEREVVNSSLNPSGWERESRESREDWDTQSTHSQRSDHHRNRQVRNQHQDNRNQHDHNKRYSGNRNRNRNTNENDNNNWRPESPRGFNNRRDTRQGSEPPQNNNINQQVNTNDNNNSNNNNRTRDTRSVEPMGYDKFQRKPPTGRYRNNMKAPIKIENLPPRLQKKYREENGLEHPPSYQDDNYDPIPTNPSGYYPHGAKLPNSKTMDNIQQKINLQPPQNWSNTIPARSRGRGRLRPDELDTHYRPNTPDQYSAPNSRSHTPNQELINRSYDRRGSNSTMYTSIESLSKDNITMPPPSSSSQPPSLLSLQTIAPTTIHNQSGYNRQSRSSSNNYQSQQQKNNNNNNNFKNHNRNNENLNDKQKQNDKNQLTTIINNNKIESSINLHYDMPIERLDWSEEVDIEEELNFDNDKDSRSSSVMSYHDNPSISGDNTIRNRSVRRKKRRDRRYNEQRSDDSCEKINNKRDNSRELINNQHNRENNCFNINNSNDNQNSNNNNCRNERYDNRRRQNINHKSRESSKERCYKRNDDTTIKNRIDIEENWRTGKRISICDSEDDRKTPSMSNFNLSTRSISPVKLNNSQQPGILVLPDTPVNTNTNTNIIKNDKRTSPGTQKILFDPNNPNKPIIVPSSNSTRTNDGCLNTSVNYSPSSFQLSLQLDGTPLSYITDQIINQRPSWYDSVSDTLKSSKNPCLLLGVETMDRELTRLLSSSGLAANWDRVEFLRHSLQQSLTTLLKTDLKFCQTENIEQHFWKILYYNIIEMLRKIMIKEDNEGKKLCKKTMLKMIDDGVCYFESLLNILETTYNFKLDTYLSSSSPPKGLGFIGLALNSAQKIFLFLGDLARYKEQANETTNYGKSRQWYLKAQQINSKNGRPYNQLALLAHYARRKLDAVYYYMRALMASNPFHSARESLIALFDENRKKYESTERKRKEEREWKERARMKEKEGANNISGGLRREIWIHPDGKRMRRTTSTASASDVVAISDLEELAQLSSVEVNKRFVTSYLHVHGKLITKIGMETFQEAAIQMLREFRALLQHTPLPLPGTRLLQLLALNMFAIETTQLKDLQMEQGYRSEVQERALVVSLQMFNLIVERGVSLLKSQLENQQQPRLVVDEDMQVLLPAIKIWCDWMLCHSTVWNPPPSCMDYRVGPTGDAWSRLATMVNLLERLPYSKKVLIHSRDPVERENELNLVRLPEDTTLSGFTPLMSNPPEPFYVLKIDDEEVAQVCLRIHKILFFGQVFLCGLETPVLKLQKSETGISEYVSLVETSNTGSINTPPEHSDSELLVDSYSEDDDDDNAISLKKNFFTNDTNDLKSQPEIRSLIERKEELERCQKKQEHHRKRIQDILQKSPLSVEIEIRPRQLVPDTNCFIDYLSQLQIITRAVSGTQPLFTLMVPLVVLNELEGLARGADPKDGPISRSALTSDHIARVAKSAKLALEFARSKNPAIRCLTTRGTVLSSSTFTVEEDVTLDGLTSNDDRILATCLSLCKTNNKDHIVNEEGQPRRLRRDVVLLTEDRNLRVKALSRDVPVREVPDFMQWASLG